MFYTVFAVAIGTIENDTKLTSTFAFSQGNSVWSTPELEYMGAERSVHHLNILSHIIALQRPWVR